MRISLVPRERRFYDLFDQQAEHIVAAAELLCRLLGDYRDVAATQARIKEHEHRGDDLTHEVVRTLNRTFVTPFDREDIYALASGLDDVLDFIDETVNTLLLYDIRSIPPPAGEQAELLLAASQEIRQAVSKLEAQRGLEAHWIEVHRIENVGDAVSRRAIGELFTGGIEPLEVVKLKDLYGLLESALDRCEDVANVIESITIKNA